MLAVKNPHVLPLVARSIARKLPDGGTEGDEELLETSLAVKPRPMTPKANAANMRTKKRAGRNRRRGPGTSPPSTGSVFNAAASSMSTERLVPSLPCGLVAIDFSEVTSSRATDLQGPGPSRRDAAEKAASPGRPSR